jgi:hypothetical protein
MNGGTQPGGRYRERHRKAVTKGLKLSSLKSVNPN